MCRIVKYIINLLILCSVTVAGEANKKRSIDIREVLVLDEKNAFVKVGEITTDIRGNIFVSDDYGYSIKQFNSQGVFQREFGKKGKNKGEFLSFPFRLICLKDTLAIAELGSSRIQLFDAHGDVIGDLSATGAIIDIAFARTGNIFASLVPFSHGKEDVLLFYTKSGTLISRILLRKSAGESALDMVQLAVDRRDNLIVAYHFINDIAVYDNKQAVISEFKIPGLPDSSITTKSRYAGVGAVPDGEMIKDIAVDSFGNIFALTGNYADNPEKDIVVMNIHGDFLTKFTLPDRTGFIYIDDDGNLYTREKHRTIVKKYKLMYHGF